jgi:hypothetical protein
MICLLTSADATFWFIEEASLVMIMRRCNTVSRKEEEAWPIFTIWWASV